MLVWQQPPRCARQVTGPGATPLDKDPCPEVPNGARGCESLISARRISWFGYLARWMRIFEVFSVPRTTPGDYAILCTQLCGSGHYRMAATLRVLPPEAFTQWLKEHQPSTGGPQ